MTGSNPISSYHTFSKKDYNNLIFMMTATISLAFVFYLILPDVDKYPLNLFLLFMGPFYIGVILHLLVYYNCPFLVIYKEGLRKQKYFLSSKPFLKRQRFIPFSSIKSIQLKDKEKSIWVEQAPYLALEMKDGQEERVYLKNDKIIPEIIEILKDNFRDFMDMRKHREEEHIPEIEAINTEKMGLKETKMVKIQCPQCSEVISYREDSKPWVIKCPNCSYEPERAIIKWLYLLDQNDEVFDRCPKCEKYSQISAENKKKHVQFTCQNCDYKFIIDKRGSIRHMEKQSTPPIP